VFVIRYCVLVEPYVVANSASVHFAVRLTVKYVNVRVVCSEKH